MNNNKLIAQNVFKVIGGTPKVVEYADNDKRSKVDIYVGADRPDVGLSSYSTVGLSDYSIGLKGENSEDIRVEFIGVCGSDAEKFPNIIATCAFNIINDNFSCKPSAVYPNVVKEYYEKIEMEHIYFTTPFLFDGLRNIMVDNKTVTWLLAMPISNNEFDFLKSNGSDMLEDLFEKENINIYDIGRKSVL